MNTQSPFSENFATIKVIGVGGGGQNAVERMIEEGVQGVEFVAINTDAQALLKSSAPQRIRIGEKLTKGLGAGAQAEIGQKAAEENLSDIEATVADADLVFITAGLGGGTGSGAAAIVAETAATAGALTVGVVTMPFATEGQVRKSVADRALQRLQEYVNALIVIENDRLLDILDKKATVVEAFRTADEILKQGVQGLSDMITIEGEINLDFADIKTVLEKGGGAFMAIGKGVGDNRAAEAADQVISSTLLNSTIAGASGVAYNIKAQSAPQLQEFAEIGQAIKSEVSPNAEIFQGWAIDPDLGDEIHVTLLATGIPHDRLNGNAGTLNEFIGQDTRRTRHARQPTSTTRTRVTDTQEVERVPLNQGRRQRSGLPSFISSS